MHQHTTLTQPIYFTVFGREKNQGQIAKNKLTQLQLFTPLLYVISTLKSKYSFAFHKQLVNFDLPIFSLFPEGEIRDPIPKQS